MSPTLSPGALALLHELKVGPQRERWDSPSSPRKLLFIELARSFMADAFVIGPEVSEWRITEIGELYLAPIDAPTITDATLSPEALALLRDMDRALEVSELIIDGHDRVHAGVELHDRGFIHGVAFSAPDGEPRLWVTPAGRAHLAAIDAAAGSEADSDSDERRWLRHQGPGHG